jgi:hypothetical protein
VRNTATDSFVVAVHFQVGNPFFQLRQNFVLLPPKMIFDHLSQGKNIFNGSLNESAQAPRSKGARKEVQADALATLDFDFRLPNFFF